MGDIADMMIEGTLCAGCGVFLNEEAPGYPCYCRDCKRDGTAASQNPSPAKKTGGLQKLPRVQCNLCKRWISPRGIQSHNHAMHKGDKNVATPV